MTAPRDDTYPGDDEPLHEAEARRAVEIAVGVREQVRKALSAEGVPLLPS